MENEILSSAMILATQVLVIVVFSRLAGIAMRFFGQPAVVGEMIAGIVLGHSVFGLVWPSGFQAVFPAASMPNLYVLAQLGLILFMFVVGMDLKIEHLKSKAKMAVVISHASIVAPFLLGAGAAFAIHETYQPAGFPFSSFALFMGIAMSITAFPVLARILQEKGLQHTKLGSMALTCAAVDDVTAWCLLAVILSIVKSGSLLGAAGVIAASLLYVVVMLKLVRPALACLYARWPHEQLRPALVAAAVLALSSAATSWIGIHALFGAFLAGAILPKNTGLREGLIDKLETTCLIVLLPLFFAYTGLRMQIGLLHTADAWTVCAGLIGIAILGKLGASALAARWSGMTWDEAWSLGVLMNTRGLMELVVLNIGYEIGILTPEIFAMMVIMALVTTAMTGPLLGLARRI